MAWTRKTIENTVIISLAVLTAAALVYVPLSSYLPFKENQDNIIFLSIISRKFGIKMTLT